MGAGGFPGSGSAGLCAAEPTNLTCHLAACVCGWRRGWRRGWSQRSFPWQHHHKWLRRAETVNISHHSSARRRSFGPFISDLPRRRRIRVLLLQHTRRRPVRYQRYPVPCPVLVRWNDALLTFSTPPPHTHTHPTPTPSYGCYDITFNVISPIKKY